MKNPSRLAKTRPAETAGPVAMAVAMLISKLVGVEDMDTVAYISIIVAFVPAAVTWTVEILRG